MTRFLQFAALLTLLFAGLPMAARTVDEVPNVHVQDRTQFVSDPDNVLSPAAIDSLNRTLANIWETTTAEPVVVVIEKMQEYGNIDDFATELFRKWGIGKKDKSNGLLILVSRGDRKACIRTGYGVEGVLPDVIASRLLRNEMFPRFRQGDYDGGVIATVNEIEHIFTDPEYAEELHSAYGNDLGDDDMADLFYAYIFVSGLFGVLMFLYVLANMYDVRKKDTVTAWQHLQSMNLVLIVGSCFTLGMMLPALLLLTWAKRRIRTKPLPCPHCGTITHLLDEATDNQYLTPAQDTEERINSVDYDVHLCPNCGYTRVDAFVNKNKKYEVCSVCGARACREIGSVVIRPATTRSTGLASKVYLCENCGNKDTRDVTLPRKESLPNVVIIPGSGGSSSGGFSGGSFGGGFTGGGGASGGW
ncbi:MAG: TPM domain-containing protein [Muribaculaceae bacterium]|nr:TPM domain-containing protein [Muribaculaceae bacterium]